MKLEIDPHSMTLGEMEDFEAAAGASFAELAKLFDSGQPVRMSEIPIRILTAMVWIFGRRADPELTIEATRKIKLMDLAAELPPSTAGEAASSATSRSSRTSTSSRRRNSGV